MLATIPYPADPCAVGTLHILFDCKWWNTASPVDLCKGCTILENCFRLDIVLVKVAVYHMGGMSTNSYADRSLALVKQREPVSVPELP